MFKKNLIAAGMAATLVIGSANAALAFGPSGGGFSGVESSFQGGGFSGVESSFQGGGFGGDFQFYQFFHHGRFLLCFGTAFLLLISS